MSSRLRSIAGLAGAVFTLLLASSCTDELVAPPVRAASASRSIAPVEEPSGIALSFNGTSSWAATSAGSLVTFTSDDIRLEAWINWSGPTPSQSQTVIYNGATNLGGWGIMLKDGKVAILAGGQGFPTTMLAPSIGVWQHVSAERHADNTVVVELDGATEMVSVSARGPIAGSPRTMVGAAAGTNGQGGEPSMVFNGSIDNARFMKLDGTLLESWDFENATATAAEGSKGFHLALHDVGIETLGTLDVVIDPRHENRVIEPERGRNVAVAVLSSPEFDATTIDRSTVTFGPARASALTANRVDIDDDGDRDMVYRFDLSDAGITCMDRRATLRATAAGVPASGTAEIHTLVADLLPGNFIVRCASPRIVATELAHPEFTPVSINDHGQMAGYTADPLGNAFPARLDGDVLMRPDLPGLVYGGATPITDRGQIGLTTYDINDIEFKNPSMFVWSGSSVTPLAIGEDSALFHFMNDHGDAAGQIMSPTWGDPSALWLMRNGKLDKLATNASRRNLWMFGLTNAGVAGISFADERRGHVALWNGKKVNDLTRRDESASVVAMNERGQIVGVSSPISDPSQYKPTMWTDAGAVTLAASGFPHAINKRGDVAIEDALNISVWRQGRLTLLGRGTFAGMNDAGDVVLNTNAGPVLHLSDGSAIPLFDGQLRDRSPAAAMINNSGEIVGGMAFTTNPLVWRVSRR